MIKHNNNIDLKPVHKYKLNSYFKLTRPEGLAYEFALPLFGSYLATKNILFEGGLGGVTLYCTKQRTFVLFPQEEDMLLLLLSFVKPRIPD